MDFLGSVIGSVLEIVKYSCSPLVRQAGYVKNLKKNFEKLKEKAREMYDKRDDIKHEIRRNGDRKIPTRECESWLKEVEDIEKQVNAIEEEYKRKDMERMRVCFLSQVKLGKCMVKTISHISDLTERANFQGGVVVDALPEVIEAIPAPTIEADTAAFRTLQKILKCIKEASTRKIGIWGMGGVGKTTIMKMLNNLPETNGMFDIVIWVTVSKDLSLRNIQNEISKRLSLKIDNDESDNAVARRLFHRLRTMKFLLLMDDVWAKVDLEDVGVPHPNQDNGSKLVLTTRLRQVCHKMGTDEEIQVEVLSSEEAWKLFSDTVGKVIDSPSIQCIARGVVEECGGLPLAIIVIGASLRKEDDVYVWKNALKELSSPATSEIEDMEEQVFKRLKFSFDRLKNDTIKDCFLYGALYPEDHSVYVHELIGYWRAEGLIDVERNLTEAREKGHAILKDLTDASLLERIDDFRVKMHDVIRDLALRITSLMGESSRFVVKARLKIEEPPKLEDWEQAVRISLMENKLNSLPKSLNCPMLLTLLLQGNETLKTIPNTFFEHMSALRVVDLSQTNIASLPASICNLVNLRGLYLTFCNNLRALPPDVGALKRLEVLDLRYTGIVALPNEIGELTCLRNFHVRFYDGGDSKDLIIPVGIISRLSLLELLVIDFLLELVQNRWDECAEDVMRDLSSLKELSILKFDFPKSEYLEHFLQRSQPWRLAGLTSFYFSVGRYKIQASSYSDFTLDSMGGVGHNRILKFCGGDSIPHAILEVLSRADSFKLVGHRSICSLWEFGVQNMNELKRCMVSECDEIEIIMDRNGLQDVALPNLEYLNIQHMPNIRCIWEGQLPPGSLASLRRLKLEYCNKLTKIFSRGIIQQLSNLEDLTVQFCSAIEELVNEEVMVAESDLVFPMLKSLCISNLPQLVGIWQGGSIYLPSLEVITIYNCRNIKNLPLGVQVAPRLRKIRCEREWWEALEWEDYSIKLQLQPLFVPDLKPGTNIKF
ncbi:disease resistance protein At4g27190-like [Magnolia sinica]|uniref:disease resistance protein At4g27190-like n=1 Tax=Magnolia sinica TaxID=86752 RepID=UPI00265B2241|nr:disease resistance protein At4g27190-like [Magnolia sinica]XP_058093984.1 disease resistance protein At4g27190-like [Magnolia sinica]XP_058093985.1 disease resistance protein At4g27190-like [Magnolia sinica]XP_058093986.1 disease resistance protein At4g27190-like [Magnolia sinica]XP_058093987.1 disease resistance protein At4g27190-like [Magnolia sinica]XP_058093988.1 disease resistance protein At4g27190-like [Magnolia sinica]XP_058093989.1 disease resistance protein At4g27190-like [Magnoli